MLNSLQSVVMLDAASPRLVVDILSLVLIFSLSLSPILFCSNRLFRCRSYGYSTHIYKDEDGVATHEAMKRNPDRVPVTILTCCLSVNALLSLTRATIPDVVNCKSQSTLHVWVQFSVAVLLVLQGCGILCAPAASAARFRLGLHNAASCAVAAATLGLQIRSQYRTGSMTTIHIALIGNEFIITAIAGCWALLLQKRPDIWHNGSVVDRQHSVSFLGRLSFSWTIPLLLTAIRNGNLNVHDLPQLDHRTRARGLFSSFSNAAGGQGSSGIWWTIARAHGGSLAVQLLLSLTSAVMAFLPRLALLGILQTLDAGAAGTRKDLRLWSYVVALGLSSIATNTLTTWKLWSAVNIISTRVYAQLTTTIYDKAMRLSGAGGSDAGEGNTDSGNASQITINAVASETKAIASFVGDSYQLLETPVSLIGCGILLLLLLGWQSLLGGVLTVLLIGPAHGYMVKRYVSTTRSMLARRDSRMSILSELIHGIRQVKFLAAEDEWEEKVNRSRDVEVDAVSRSISCNVLISSVCLAQPILLAVATLSLYSLTHPSPSASTAFTSLTILNIMEQALDSLPLLQMRLVNVILFARRIDTYLNQPEKVPYIVPSDEIELDNATIVWPGCRPLPGQKPKTGLSNVNLKFPKDQLSVVSGPTGSGKSLLLSCLIGECELITGTVKAPSSSKAHPPRGQWLVSSAVAYVSQTAWIETGTVRDNILFGCPYLPGRYNEVLSACALRADLELLSDGDMTQVGGNGVNLSGGQKSRLSLARALYSRAQTLVMDDVFSAVDVHTAKHLYELALTGPLAAGRTRVLATYQVELCLVKAEHVVFLDGQGGCQGAAVTETQRLQSLFAESQPKEMRCAEDNISEATSLAEDRSVATATEPFTSNDHIDRNDSVASRKPPDAHNNGGQVRSIQWKTVKDFVRYSGSIYNWILVLALFVVYGVLTLGRGYAIKLWTSQDTNSHPASQNSNRYLIIYIAVSGAAIITGALRTHFTLSSGLRSSVAIFRRILHNVLRARLRWLDLTPAGSLISRFSADCAVVDQQLGNSLKQFLFLVVNIAAVIASGAIEVPSLMAFAGVLLGFCFWCAGYYVVAARQLKRLESSALEPIFDYMSSSATGISTIRAFGRVDSYLDGFLTRVDQYSRSFWHLWLLNRWMGFWMNIVGAVFSTVTAVALLSMPHVDAAAAGLAISFTMRLGDDLINMVQAYTALEMDFNSAYRLLEYTNLELEDGSGTEPPAAWPTQYRLQVSDLVARYSPELPPVLRGLNMQVDGHQRIGVVGRTGAGKSSLSLALMRFLQVEGDVRIDGVDVSRVPLRRLRQTVSLIPQSPILFSGTVRSNLDPFDQFDDADIIAALESVHWHWCGSDASERTFKADVETAASSASSTILLSDDEVSPIKTTPSSILHRTISESGSNLSPGERQLLCLARAILTRPKFLILDESTSSVDKMADAVIQQSIRTEFRHSSTLIVIAHRLRTIVDFDRILVLDQGRAAEFGRPADLLQREGGIFRGMVEGDVERNMLEGIILSNESRLITPDVNI